MASDSVRSVARAMEILHILSFNASSSGMRFSDLQAQSGLSKGTLHRLLKSLVASGFVEQAAGSRVYYLGLEFLSMGERAANRLDIRAVTQPSLERLANLTGDTVMLTIRSGLDAVCIDRAEGSFPVKVLTQNIGTRRPLGVGSGALALLAAARVMMREGLAQIAYPVTLQLPAKGPFSTAFTVTAVRPGFGMIPVMDTRPRAPLSSAPVP